ncbi:Uncharacterised protein [Vibrio cholerae]|nr:Uncharacterised protein [Vibrio cholerae]
MSFVIIQFDQNLTFFNLLIGLHRNHVHFTRHFSGNVDRLLGFKLTHNRKRLRNLLRLNRLCHNRNRGRLVRLFGR